MDTVNDIQDTTHGTNSVFVLQDCLMLRLNLQLQIIIVNMSDIKSVTQGFLISFEAAYCVSYVRFKLINFWRINHVDAPRKSLKT